MQVYLTGVNTIKHPKSYSAQKIKSKFSQHQNQSKPKKEEIKEKKSINIIEEDNISEMNKLEQVDASKNISIRSFKSLKRNLNYYPEKNKNNNFISKDDTKKKKSFLCQRDFSNMRHQSSENKKINDKIENELKEDYLEYIMSKEPKYADFEAISQDHRKKIYINFQKYNNNLLVISSKKEEYKKILSEIEKSLINNYYLKDSSMIPVYEKLIEKVKYDILTKQQEHDGYHKLYEELYNQNYTLKRKVLDEIDIDRVNENFYDQYKILENHAIVQVSNKQDSLNQVEEYQKKIIEEHEKEIIQKHKILKELKLQIEVFKEDEKDLVHKFKKLKDKREQVNNTIKEKVKLKQSINKNYLSQIRKYQKSYISINKIFKSVNAKNLDDVLVDVNFIKAKFNKLKNNIINMNLNLSNLNSEYSKLDKDLHQVKQEIILTKNKKKTILNQRDQKRSIEIKNELKKLNEIENRIKETTQKNIGTFQQGITFIFRKIKLLVANIPFLKKSISPKLIELINKYKNTPFSVNYEKIDKEFLTNFTFLFFQFSNNLFYLSLHSMSSGLNLNNVNQKQIITPIYSKVSLNLYKSGVKRALNEYDRRASIKREKQKEINIRAKNKEIEEKIDKNIMKENKAITQNQMFDRFVDYLYNKESNSHKSKKNENDNIMNMTKNSIFFTGIDSIKVTNSKNIENSSTNSRFSETFNKLKDRETKIDKAKGVSITFKQKEEFLKKNKNKLMNIFSKYQNDLVKENEKKLYFKKKYMKKIPRTRSQEYSIKRPNYSFINNKRRIMKEENIFMENNKSALSFIDENYEYDEDDEKEERKMKYSLKKNKTFSHYSFFRLNKDRANIYKKMNDLRKLQMSYFGGRFLNTKINSGMNTTYGSGILEEFVNNFYKRQNVHNNLRNKNNKVRLNFDKRLVDHITANQKLRSKTTAVIRPPQRCKSYNIFNIREKNKFKKINDKMKSSSTLYNKKSTFVSSKNDKSTSKYRKIDNTNNKNFSRSCSNNDNYKTILIRKKFSKSRERSEISNYNSKKW